MSGKFLESIIVALIYQSVMSSNQTEFFAEYRTRWPSNSWFPVINTFSLIFHVYNLWYLIQLLESQQEITWV